MTARSALQSRETVSTNELVARVVPNAMSDAVREPPSSALALPAVALAKAGPDAVGHESLGGFRYANHRMGLDRMAMALGFSGPE